MEKNYISPYFGHPAYNDVENLFTIPAVHRIVFTKNLSSVIPSVLPIDRLHTKGKVDLFFFHDLSYTILYYNREVFLHFPHEFLFALNFKFH